MTYDPAVWDTVKVPFPYTDRPTRQRRPALVVARVGTLTWVLMITSAENRGWPDDVEVSDLGHAGLPVASVIRPAKIATIDARDVEALGKLAEDNQQAISRALGHILSGAGLKAEP